VLSDRKLLSQRAWAKRQGFTSGYVTQLLQAGIIELTPEGKIDAEAADARLAAHRNPARPLLRKGTPAPEVLDALGIDEAAPGDDDGSLSTRYLEAKLEHELERVRLARLKADEQEGKLVLTADVERRWFEVARITRNSMLAIPDRLAAQLAGLSDPKQVHRVLTVELKQALADLADGFENGTTDIDN
jgi:phage FluMu protein gp41